MNKKIARWIFYFLGLLILSLGIVLNTKSKFGVTPIISLAYCYSTIKGVNFGNASFVLYCILAAIEYLVKGRNFKLYDLLQIPLSMVLTRFFNLFGAVLPDVASMPARIVCLILGIALTGVGAAMNVNTRLVPNPGDGIVQAFADRLHQRLGNVKNVFDLVCVALTCLMSYVMTGGIVGIGVGTVAAMIGVGRFMWLYNQFFKARQLSATGLTQ